jgi:hypothetical protein
MSVNSNSPFNLNKAVNFLSNGFHNLTVRVCDDVDNCSEQKIEFNLTKNSKPKIIQISIALTRPAEATNIIKYDFPLALKAEATNPEQVAGVTFYFKDSSGKTQKIAQSQIIDKTAEAQMTNILTPGSYKFYAEARGWYGQTAVSAEVSVTVNNPPATATTTPPVVQ